MTLEELNKQFKELSDNQEIMKKDFTIKLEATQKEAKQYQELAEKREKEILDLKSSSEKEKKEQEKRFQEMREQEIDAFIAAETKAGRLIPAMHDSVRAFMKKLDSSEKVLEFKEKDGASKSHTMLSLFKEILSAIKQRAVSYEEVGKVGSLTPSTPDSSAGAEGEEQFVEIREKGVTKRYAMADMDMHLKAIEYQGLHKDCSYEDALIAVSPKQAKL